MKKFWVKRLQVVADNICKQEDAVAAAKTCYIILCPGRLGVLVYSYLNHKCGVDIFLRKNAFELDSMSW